MTLRVICVHLWLNRVWLLPRGRARISHVRSEEAASGFAPERNGFADRRLTAWLSRRLGKDEGQTAGLRRAPLGPRILEERETGFEPATPTLAR